MLALVTLRHYSLLPRIFRLTKQKLTSNSPLPFTGCEIRGTWHTDCHFQEDNRLAWAEEPFCLSLWISERNFLDFKISSEEYAPSVVPLLQRENRRLSNYGALSPRNVSLLHFKLCSERWQTNDHFNFCQEEKHMAGASEVSSLILPLTETIWAE